MGGTGGQRTAETVAERQVGWLDDMENAILTAMRPLDDIEAWPAPAEAVMTLLSERTPPALHRVLAQRPHVSAAMAEAVTIASRF